MSHVTIFVFTKYHFIWFNIDGKPTEMFDKIFEDCGGVVGVSSCWYLPRNKSNIKAGIKPQSEDYDPLFLP